MPELYRFEFSWLLMELDEVDEAEETGLGCGCGNVCQRCGRLTCCHRCLS